MVPVHVPRPPVPTPDVPIYIAPTGNTPAAMFCSEFNCGEGFQLIDNAETTIGDTFEACCLSATGACAGASEGSPCSLGELGSSLIPNPSFEDFSRCPTSFTQLSRAISWVQATGATSDFWVGAPSCNDFWRTGFGTPGDFVGEIPQQATDGDAIVGSIKAEGYHEYIGACLNSPLQAMESFTFTLNIAAAASNAQFGGDTNGITDLLCIPSCSSFPISGQDYKGDEFGILATASPDGGLVGGGPWKSITFEVTPTQNCDAIMFGPSLTQSVEEGQKGSYIIYDFLNLQEGVAGACNSMGECVPAGDVPIVTAPTGAGPTVPISFNAPSPVAPLPIEDQDTEVTCVAIIDENDGSDRNVETEWTEFRNTYPSRPFCLLRAPYPSLRLTLPQGFPTSSDIFANVTRDADDVDPATRSNWFNLCNLAGSRARGLTNVVLFVDNSGSMTTGSVQNAHDDFQAAVIANGMQVVDAVYNNQENYILPCLSTSLLNP